MRVSGVDGDEVMIYSKDDVKRILDEIRKLTPKWLEECLRGDSIKEEAAEELSLVLDRIEAKLEFKDDGVCGVCRGSNGKHSSLCGEQYV